MRVQQLIEKTLAEGLEPLHLEVTNESHRHNVPPGSESHFKVVLVSDAFAGRSLIQRHRLVHELLADPMRQEIHALALHTYAPQEWRERDEGAPASPPCLGGGARKRA